jgi:hypothetical protein
MQGEIHDSLLNPTSVDQRKNFGNSA